MCRYDERFVDSYLHGDLCLVACCPDDAQTMPIVYIQYWVRVLCRWLCMYSVPDSLRIFIPKDERRISSTSSSSSKVLRNLFIHDKCECTKARRYITIFRPLCQCGCPVWVRVFLLFQSTYTFLELGLKPSCCLLLYYVDQKLLTDR